VSFLRYGKGESKKWQKEKNMITKTAD